MDFLIDPIAAFTFMIRTQDWRAGLGPEKGPASILLAEPVLLGTAPRGTLERNVPSHDGNDVMVT
jgi:hypothetical protein